MARRSGQLLGAVQVVWDGKPSDNGHAFVPHGEGGAHRLREGDIKGVEVDGVQSIVERDGAVVIVQQDADAPEVGGGLDGDLLAVVSHHPVIVAAAQCPGSRVLPNPLVLWGRFVRKANGIPCASTYDHFPVMPATINEHVSSYAVRPLAGEAFGCVALFG